MANEINREEPVSENLRIKHEEDLEMRVRSLTVKRWLRTDEVVIYLGTTLNAVKKLRARNRIVPKKFGGRNYYDRLLIDANIENSGRVELTNLRSKRWR